MNWGKLLLNVVTLGIPAIIKAASEARRKKREQKARIKKEAAAKAATVAKNDKK